MQNLAVHPFFLNHSVREKTYYIKPEKMLGTYFLKIEIFSSYVKKKNVLNF